MRPLLNCLLACVSLVAFGCGGSSNGPPMENVSGTVTFDGTSVALGEVVFLPADGKGRSDAGKIVDGKFQFQVPAGAKKVQITATRESAEKAPDGLPNFVSYIPANYNENTTLTAEVKKGAKNEFPFALTSK